MNNGQLKRIIIENLWQQPMTLTDLHTNTPVSVPTLRRAINELTDMQWITTVGQNESTGGRPANLFGINGEAHIIVGAHAEIPVVNLVATQLDGEVIDCQRITDFAPLLPEHTVDAFTAYVNRLRSRFPERNILGIGMAAPGYVDEKTGDILFVGRALGWENFPMRARLENQTGLPIVMENDSDCRVRAEIDGLDVTHYRSIIYIAVGEGVKASLLFDGNLYRGAFSNAGLIGRSKLPPRNGFDDYYDLEHRAAVAGICAMFDKYAVQSPDATTQALQVIEDRNERYLAILQHADAGHPVCLQVVDFMLEDLTLTVSNLIYVLQPNILFLGGLLSLIPDGLKSRLEQEIRTKLPSLLSNHLIINFAEVTGHYSAAIGATRWFLQRVINSEDLFDQLMEAQIT